MEEKAKVFGFSCRKATELIEKRTILKLSAVERMQLFLHSCVCDGCRYYSKQSKLIDQLIRKQTTSFSSLKNGLHLDDSIKSNIINELEKR